MAFGVGKVILAVALAVTSPVLTAGAAAAVAGGAIVASKVLNSKEYDANSTINYRGTNINVNFSKATLADPLGQGSLPVDDKSISWAHSGTSNSGRDKRGNPFLEQKYTSGDMTRTLRLTQASGGKVQALITDEWTDLSTGQKAKRKISTISPIQLTGGDINIGTLNTRAKQWLPGDEDHLKGKPNASWKYPSTNAAAPAVTFDNFLNSAHKHPKKSTLFVHNMMYTGQENLKWAGYEVGSGLTAIGSNASGYVKNVAMNPLVLGLGFVSGALPALAVVALCSYGIERGLATASNNFGTWAGQVSNNLALAKGRTP